MFSADDIARILEEKKQSGTPLQQVAWDIALLCKGWAYVFGARGEYCTPANRRARYSDAHPTIKTKCQNFDGAGKCTGCKWYPREEKTRVFDCRGFTYWVLHQVYGWKLMGAGATSQWNTGSNWKAKGEIGTLPGDSLVCLFIRKGSKMEHTGFGYRGETLECSAGVQHSATTGAKWTHWALPACVEGDAPPVPVPRPTLRRGASGPYVTLAQTQLIQRGYSCGLSGADGVFGAGTETAVRTFQQDNGLTADGIIGPMTWAALDSTEPVPTYTLTIPHLSKSRADALISQYPGATMTEERG